MATFSPSTLPSATTAAQPAGWKVDVENHLAIPAIVSITTPSGAWAWKVNAGEEEVLLALAESPTEAMLEVIDGTGSSCTVLGSGAMPLTSLTIVLEHTAVDRYVTLTNGAPLSGEPDKNYEAGCSG